MHPLSDCWTLAFLVAGTLLSVAGIILGGIALARAWAEHGDGPLSPKLYRAIQAIRATLARLAFWRKPPKIAAASTGVSVAVGVSAEGFARVGFQDGLSQDERLERLEQAVRGVYAELTSIRNASKRTGKQLTSRLADLETRLHSEGDRLEALTRGIASADVRIQLVGLVCIGVGTVLLAVPSVVRVLASVW